MKYIEFQDKWSGKDPDEMSDEQLRQFKEDCFQMYEHTGFLETLDSTYDEDSENNGKRFKVLRRAACNECDLESMPIWLIRFEDGTEAYCYPEEICKLEHLDADYGHVAVLLRDFLETGKAGDSRRVFLKNWSERHPDEYDTIYATLMEHATGRGVLLHYDLYGDWTRALLLNTENFEEEDLCSVIEALDWFDNA